MLHWQFRFVMRPDYLYFWDPSNDHSSAHTLQILMRITHNQDMICIIVVLEAQLLAIPLEKVPAGPRFLKIFKNLKNLKNLNKIQGILIRNNVFVAWACCMNT